ncbi:hydroxyphenylacetyl-CoA thioesterase PaaI [Actinotalea sp. AC32]|nr:hydroxyphenylacetyl-CoA thioesterase PaaI [Actinotalea sp. AC32]
MSGATSTGTGTGTGAGAGAGAGTGTGAGAGTGTVAGTGAPDADALARRCAEAMWAADPASRRLGMRLAAVGPGTARVTMRVTGDMLNGHGTCHGGYLAALADSAFAFACNTEDEVTVAAGFDIVFVEPAVLDDDLTADAARRVRRGRSGLYDVTVTRADGTVIAEYRGRSRSLGRPLLAAGPTGPMTTASPAVPPTDGGRA